MLAAFRLLEQELRQECGLNLQVDKCELYCQNGEMPPNCPPGVSRAGAVVDGVFEPGFLAVGVPVGSDNYAVRA